MDISVFYRKIPMSSSFPKLEKLFGLQAQLDMDNIPETMEEYVEESKALLIDNVTISVKYAQFSLTGLESNSVTFSKDCNNEKNHECANSSDFILKGTLLPSILEDCHSIVLYTLTLSGYEKVQEICQDDMLLAFFADAWGSAYAESADTFFLDNLRKEYAQKNTYMTISHNPGQHLFPLDNQRLFFDLLKPEDIGLTLTDSCLMLPSKSISGIMGLSDRPQDLSKVSCDFCSLKDTCPTAYAHANC